MHTREERENLKNLIRAIETGGGTWEFIPERADSWTKLLHIYYGKVPERARNIFIHMEDGLTLLYSNLSNMKLVSGQSITVVTNDMTQLQKDLARGAKRVIRGIEAGYKELKLMLGKIDVELGLDTEYSKFYKRHKPRSREVKV